MPGLGAHIRADHPLTDPSQDRLGRASFAIGVAEAIRGRSDRSTVVVGIYGPWGDGKTTVLNFVQGALAGTPNLVVVPFNPWLVRDEFSLLPAFFETLAAALGKQMGGRRKRAADVLRDYGGVISGVSFGVAGLNLDPGKSAEALGQALGNQSLDQKREEFEKILRDAKKRILVVIDDLDRLDDAEIHAVFKLVKLAAAFEGITYLLAFDDEKVAASLSKRYGGGGSPRGGVEFLEKIVQVPLHLPRARREALDQILLESLQEALDDAGIEVDDKAGRQFNLRYRTGLSDAINGVRSAKRYANAAAFTLALLKGEANPIDVLTIEGIHVCYPHLYQAMRDHRDWFLLREPPFGSNDEAARNSQRELIETVIERLDINHRKSALELVQQLFPQTQRLWTNTSWGSDWHEQWATEQRVCSPEYYDRYFAYALATNEVGDQEVAALLAEQRGLARGLHDFVQARGTGVVQPLLRRFDRQIDSLDRHHLDALLDAMVALGPLVAEDNVPRLFQLGGQEHTARLVARLILQLPDQRQRLVAAKRVIGAAEPLGFASECLEWLKAKASTTDETRALDREPWNIVLKQFARRIRDCLPKLGEPLWVADRRGIQVMWRAVLGGEPRAIRRHVADWLDRDPESVLSLLTVSAGTAYVGDLGLPQQRDFDRDNLKGLADFVDLKVVRRAIRRLRGNARPPAQYTSVERWDDRKPIDPGLVIDQFLYLYARPAEDETAAAAAPSVE